MNKFKKCITVILLLCSLIVNSVTGIVTAKTSVYGDLNNDGSVTILDLIYMNNYLNGSLELTDSQLAVFDLNNNYVVTEVDSLVLQNMILN